MKTVVSFLIVFVQWHIATAAASITGTGSALDDRVQKACIIDHSPQVKDLAGASYLPYVKSAHLRTRDRTYRFVYVPESCDDKGDILFLHGFPSSSFDWRHQIEYFRSQGYGVIAPDLLGYGGTDKPDDIGAYRIKPIVEDVISLLDCLNIDTVHAVGHDFGSPLLSRVANFYPSRLLTSTFIDVGYAAPPLPLDKASIQKVNNVTLQTLGFEAFGYWSFLTQPHAGKVINAHLNSMWSITYTNTPQIWKTDFAPPGALKKFLERNKMAPWGGFTSRKEREIHNRIFDPARKGYITPLNWYKAAYRNLNAQDETTVPPSSVQLKMPVLVLGAKNDPVGAPDAARNSTEPYASDFHFRVIDSGHFVMLEKPDDVNAVLQEFFQNSTSPAI